MIKVLVADDHAVVREGLKQILADTSDIELAGEAATGSEALDKVRNEDWDVVVLDISLPDRNGLDVLKQIKSGRPELPVLVLTMHGEEQYAVRVLRAGAAGYLTKETAPEQLVEAIRKVARGGKYVSPSLAEDLAFHLLSRSQKPLHETLSDREFQVLCMIASGKKAKDIAEELCLSIKTISTHRARILQKMRMKSNAELIHYSIRNRLVEGMLPEAGEESVPMPAARA
jgi:two-component system, NarL family, invasion response regulator UvrY